MDASFTRNFDPNTGKIRDGASKRNIVEFFHMDRKDTTASTAAGRPVMQSFEAIRIIVPGDQRNIVERRATSEDKIEYAREYSAFQRMESLVTEGQPIETWAPISRTLARQLKFMNIHTVEALAGLSDSQASDTRILGIRTLVNKAKVAIETAKTGAPAIALIDENESLKQEVARLRAEIEQANRRYEEALNRSGVNPADAQAASSQPATHQAPKAAEGPVIPATWQAMTDRQLMALVRNKFGVTVKDRSEAEEIVEDHLKIGKAA